MIAPYDGHCPAYRSRMLVVFVQRFVLGYVFPGHPFLLPPVHLVYTAAVGRGYARGAGRTYDTETNRRQRRQRHFLIGRKPGGKCGPIFLGGGGSRGWVGG